MLLTILLIFYFLSVGIHSLKILNYIFIGTLLRLSKFNAVCTFFES